jgi:hypothetical protein
MRARPGLLALLALAASGCVSDYENPFQMLRGSSPVPDEADLVVLSADNDVSVRDVFAVDVDGGTATRLTTCARAVPLCDILEVAPAPERQRILVRRRNDSNHDGLVGPNEEETIFSMDLSRAIEGRVLRDAPGITGIQWSDLGTNPLLFSAPGAGGLEDIFIAAVDGTEIRNISNTPDVRERQPRLEGNVLVYERAPQQGRSEIWLARGGFADAALTTGDAALSPDPLPGTTYVLGGDADPDPSPDTQSFAFRRLVGLGGDGRGLWDIATVALDGSSPTPLASGGAYRGAPDWGEPGIVFVEALEGSASASLVLAEPGGERRVLLTGPALLLHAPRWLR